MNYNSPSCTLIEIATLEIKAEDCPSDNTLRFADSDWNVIESKIEEENPSIEID